MKLSTKTRYALRATMELALNYNKGGVLLLKDVARKQGISLKYLDHIFSVLKTRELIKTAGKGKGYILSRKPCDISVYDIVEAFEGSNLILCVDESDICKRSSFCGAKVFWGKLVSVLRRELKSNSLEDLVNEQKELFKNSEEVKMYYI
ncbi:MAG: Rrf2 family transcriptional regulator [Candidatus Omnitrophota bacterium]